MSSDASIHAVPTNKAAVHAMNHHDYDESNHNNSSSSCCHSFPQFHGFELSCQQQQQQQQQDSHHHHYAQPHTLPSADTYTTVSLSQSYTSTMMWDDSDEDEDGEDYCSKDYILSPVDSVFRKDERMVEVEEEEAAAADSSSMEHRDDDPPSSYYDCSPPTTAMPPSFPSLAATKTHEAYQYLLRMTPQNYLHGSGSSSEDLESYTNCGIGSVEELDAENNNNNNCRTIGGGDNSSSTSNNFAQCGPIFLQ